VLDLQEQLGQGWGGHRYVHIRYGECGIDSTMWAIEGVMFNKATLGLGDTCNATPALETQNDQIVLAWTGCDSPARLNVMTSSDGFHFINKVTLGNNGIATPTATTA
jgi:hypothetical protein